MNLALLDFDGTITTHETFLDFIEFTAPPVRVAAGRIVLAPLVAGYKAGLVSSSRSRAAAIHFAFAGLPEARVGDAGRHFAVKVLHNMLSATAMERIAWHKMQGDCVAVVSGALAVYLIPWCREHGLELLGSRLEAHAGKLTGRYLGMQCVGEEKARRVRERFDLSAYSTVYAYGDPRGSCIAAPGA